MGAIFPREDGIGCHISYCMRGAMQTPSEVAYAPRNTLAVGPETSSSSSYNDAVTILNAVMGSTNGTV